jgi:hypothetical protein
MAFVQTAFWVVFSSAIYEFRNLEQSSFALMRLLLGQIEFEVPPAAKLARVRTHVRCVHVPFRKGSVTYIS